MKIQNPSIGEIDYNEANVILFLEGMLGLPDYKRYLLVQQDKFQPFLRLQCVDNPQISFLMIDPAYADPGYRAYVIDQDPDHVFVDKSGDVVILVVCMVTSDGSDVTANMQAPVIINHKKKTGCQIILLESPYRRKHSLTQNARRQEA